MAWTIPACTKQEINQAAKDLILLLNSKSADEWGQDEWARYDDDVSIINHWRLCHAYPLNAMQINLRWRARKFDRRPLIAQRTKRLVSIGNKLFYNPKMKLTQMQDVGGCRAVLRSAGAVENLARFIRHGSRMNHEFSTIDELYERAKRLRLSGNTFSIPFLFPSRAGIGVQRPQDRISTAVSVATCVGNYRRNRGHFSR